MWLIPGKTKIKIEIFKGVGIPDIILGIVGLALLMPILVSSFSHRFVVALVVVCIFVLLLARVDGVPNYLFFLHLFRFLGMDKYFAKENLNKNIEEDTKETVNKEAEIDVDTSEEKTKKAKKTKPVTGKDIKKITAFTDIAENKIDYNGEYFGTVIEISPIEFRFFSKSRRVASIQRGLGRILRSVSPNYSANIVKIDRPIHYDDYYDIEEQKVDALLDVYEKGQMREDELKSRVDVIQQRLESLEHLMYEKEVVVPHYYFVLYDSDKMQLENQTRRALEQLDQAELPVRRLNDKELAIFLKYSNNLDVNEEEIDALPREEYANWAMPDSVNFKVRTTEVNGVISHTFRIDNYPLLVGDAWLSTVMSMPSTKVVIKAKPMDMSKAIRGIDRSLAELKAQYRATNVDSKRYEIQEHVQSLSQLLSMVQGENESLLVVSVYVTAYDMVMTQDAPFLETPEKTRYPRYSNFKKMIRTLYRENNLKLVNNDFNQIYAYIGSQISGYDPYESEGRAIPSNTISAGYPWIFSHVSDEGGIQLGTQDGVPVFIDFFRRDSERINSNMVIIGKSGSGKSFATKSLLANLAADESKIFILDPENEYSELSHNLGGKMINVGNAKYGRLNPFHIMTAIDDEDGGSISGSYATHLQFLEEFFKQIIPDCDKDAMEYLNSIVDRMYMDKGITEETDLSKLSAEDFPIFDDLYDAILEEFQQTDNEYIRSMLRSLVNYISKFSTGGRNANIWNGPSTVTTDENFSVFNFQSLLSNRNAIIANGQMLLVLKYIDNEIIKNRDYNIRNNMNRKVIVVIDEAHVFIDEKFPIALDFMFQLAKRIRKYNGMQIVITQNIKDFVGTEELSRKSAAIINACQYSFIFPLAPNDMDDLCKLYEKAGGINEREQEGIVQASRGQAFTVLSSSARSSFMVTVPAQIRKMFESMDYTSPYFGEDNKEGWEEFIGDSRAIHEEAVASHRKEEKTEQTSLDTASAVSFEEVSEEEYTASTVSFEEIDEEEYAASTVSFEEVGEEAVDTNEEERSSVENATSAGSTADAVDIDQLTSVFTGIAKEQASIYTEGIALANQKLMEQLAEKEASSARMESVVADLIAQLSKNNNVFMESDSVNNVAASTTNHEDEWTTSEPDSDETDMDITGLFEESEAPEESSTDNEFDFDFGFGSDDSDDDDGGFDIMSLLAESSSHMDKLSSIEQMEIFDEEVLEISLEDLALYIQNMRNQKENEAY